MGNQGSDAFPTTTSLTIDVFIDENDVLAHMHVHMHSRTNENVVYAQIDFYEKRPSICAMKCLPVDLARGPGLLGAKI